jgi:hypothetical protein
LVTPQGALDKPAGKMPFRALAQVARNGRKEC